MSLQSEFCETLAWAIIAYCSGVAFLELAKEAVDAWIGRVSLLAAIQVLVCFGWHATEECSTILATKSDTPAREISEPLMAETEYQATFASGVQINWRRFDVNTNATTSINRPVLGAAERCGPIGDRGDSRSAIVCRPSGGLDCMRGTTFRRNAADGTQAAQGQTF